MVECLHRSVAGIDYLVTLLPGVVAAPGAIETEFVGHAPPARNVIRVTVAAGKMPSLGSWKLLASYGPAWSIRHHGAQRCVCLGQPTEAGSAGVVACWKVGATHATVHYGPEYLTARGDVLELRNAAGYPVDQLLYIYYLACRHGLLVHAAGLVADRRALIFPGISGAGKSTLARQFLRRGSSGLLSDDRIIVRLMDQRHVAFGTPWPGDAGVAANAGAPLAGILFPVRSETTSIRELSPQTALERLLPATSILWFEHALLSSQLETCERLLAAVPAFELSWVPGAGVVDDLREFLGRL